MEQNNTVPTQASVPVSPAPAVVSSPVISSTTQSQAVVASSTEVSYASTWSRILANFIDSFVVTIPMTIIGFVVGMVMGISRADQSLYMMVNVVINLLSILVFTTYYIYFIGAKGQTLGKMAMKIKVVKESDGSIPGYGTAFLREVVGKLISSIVFFLGYLWMIWDSKKQGWHDKVAHTVVINVKPQTTTQTTSQPPIQQPVI